MTGKYVLGNCILIIIYSSKQESRTTKPYPIILFLGSLLDLSFCSKSNFIYLIYKVCCK